MFDAGKPIYCPTCGHALEDARASDLIIGGKYEMPRTGEVVVVEKYDGTDYRFALDLVRAAPALPYLVDYAGIIHHQVTLERQHERFDPDQPGGINPGGSFELVITPTSWMVGDMVRIDP